MTCFFAAAMNVHVVVVYRGCIIVCRISLKSHIPISHKILPHGKGSTASYTSSIHVYKWGAVLIVRAMYLLISSCPQIIVALNRDLK